MKCDITFRFHIKLVLRNKSHIFGGAGQNSKTCIIQEAHVLTLKVITHNWYLLEIRGHGNLKLERS